MMKNVPLNWRIPVPGLRSFSIFLLLYTFSSALYAQELASTVKQKEEKQSVSLVNLLLEIEKKYKVKFDYEKDILQGKFVSADLLNEDPEIIERKLGEALSGLNLKLEKFDKANFLIYQEGKDKVKKINNRKTGMDNNSNNEASTRTSTALPPMKSISDRLLLFKDIRISGKVTSQDDGQGIPGVNVIVKGTSVGTTTDMEGSYSINAPDENSVLVFSFIGYTTEEVAANGQSVINVSLVSDIKQLSEVVVVGYGVQQKKDLTGAVATVNSKNIADRQSLQVSDALQGTMAGVTVTRSGGQPGATSTVRVRGVTSLNENDPLVIVDGVPGLGMNDINPNDIESLTVLKDAASQAIYGARAAAGVILITTKRATAGKLQLNYDYEYGINTPTTLPEFVDAKTYRILANERSTNDGGGNIYNPAENENYEQLNRDNPDLFPNTDWQKEILNKDQTGRQRHDLSMAVGSEKVKTRASLSYVTEDGLYANRNYERYTFRLNNNLAVSKILDVSLDLSYKKTNTLDPSQGDVIAWARRFPGIYPAVRTDGEWGEGKDGDNYLAQVTEGGTLKQDYNQYNGILGFTLKPFEGLNIRGNLSPTYNYNNFDNFTTPALIPRQGSTTEYWPLNPTIMEKRQTSFLNLTRQLTASYNKTFGENNLDFLLGYEEITADYEEIRTTSRDLSVNLRSLTFGDPSLTNNNQFSSENSLRSYFGRFNFDYKGRYIVQANLRADASSRFSADNRWGLFPSLSLGWVVTSENFKLPEVISFLKVRASYGEVGNERIGEARTGGSEFFNYYPYQNLFERDNVITYDGSYNSRLGINQTFLADNAIVWEKTKTSNIGLDFTFFNNRLSFSTDYYQKNTSDIILTLDIPNYLGYANDTKTNVGSMKVNGLDLETGFRNSVGEFNYSINVNASFVASEVTNVGGREDFTTEGGSKINILGSEFNEWFGYKTNGLFQTQEQADEYGTGAKAGDIWIVDQLTVDTDNDGIADARDNIINENDRSPLGASLPKATYGGSINFGYKGIDLSMVFMGVGEHTLRYNGFQVRPFDQTFGNIPTNLIGNFWSPTNTAAQNESAGYPRLSGRSEPFNYAVSDFWLYNGGYFRVKNITLGYSLPKNITERVSLNQVRFYVALRDYITIEKNFLKGWDPEADATGYPIMKSILFGASIRL